MCFWVMRKRFCRIRDGRIRKNSAQLEQLREALRRVGGSPCGLQDGEVGTNKMHAMNTTKLFLDDLKVERIIQCHSREGVAENAR